MNNFSLSNKLSGLSTHIQNSGKFICIYSSIGFISTFLIISLIHFGGYNYPNLFWGCIIVQPLFIASIWLVLRRAVEKAAYVAISTSAIGCFVAVGLPLTIAITFLTIFILGTQLISVNNKQLAIGYLLVLSTVTLLLLGEISSLNFTLFRSNTLPKSVALLSFLFFLSTFFFSITTSVILRKGYRDADELIAVRTKLNLLTEELQMIAHKDFLTNLPNRRGFNKDSQHEISRFKRHKKPSTILMLDIDHFKKINDTFGHECGDYVLVELAQLLLNSLRAQDIVARWGGEEFICMLPETGEESAKYVASKIRKGIENHIFKFQNKPFSITVTIGACVYNGSQSIEKCIRDADDCLYKGKEQGRNQIVF